MSSAMSAQSLRLRAPRSILWMMIPVDFFDLSRFTSLVKTGRPRLAALTCSSNHSATVIPRLDAYSNMARRCSWRETPSSPCRVVETRMYAKHVFMVDSVGLIKDQQNHMPGGGVVPDRQQRARSKKASGRNGRKRATVGPAYHQNQNHLIRAWSFSQRSRAKHHTCRTVSSITFRTYHRECAYCERRIEADGDRHITDDV